MNKYFLIILLSMNTSTYFCADNEDIPRKETVSLVDLNTTETGHPYGGYNVPKNPAFCDLCTEIFSYFKQSKQVPRILDLGAGRGTLLEYIASVPLFQSTSIYYRAIEMVPEMRIQLQALAEKAKARSPESEFKMNTEGNLDFFSWAAATKEKPFDFISAQLFLHYCGANEIFDFFNHVVQLSKQGTVISITTQNFTAAAGNTILFWPTSKSETHTPTGFSCEVLAYFLKAWGFNVNLMQNNVLNTDLDTPGDIPVSTVKGTFSGKIDETKIQFIKKKLQESNLQTVA